MSNKGWVDRVEALEAANKRLTSDNKRLRRAMENVRPPLWNDHVIRFVDRHSWWFFVAIPVALLTLSQVFYVRK